MHYQRKCDNRYLILIGYCAVWNYRSPFYQAAFMNSSCQKKEKGRHRGLLVRQLGRGKYESSDNCRARKSNSSEKSESRVVLWRGKAPNDVFHSGWWSTMSHLALTLGKRVSQLWCKKRALLYRAELVTRNKV